MGVVLTSGIFTISIDAELDVERRGLDQQRALETLTARLADLLDEYQMPATWAVADPAVSAATEPLCGSRHGHEIAVLGDKIWVGREAGRTRFGRELSRRVSHGRSAGLTLTTLLVRDSALDDHLDLAVKQGLTAVASGQLETAPRWFGQAPVRAPLPLRFGLWSFATHAVLPGRRNWLSGRARPLIRLVDAAAARQEICHFSLPLLALTDCGKSAIVAIEKLLRHVARRREQGTLDVLTLSATAQRLTGSRQAIPARSILRPAA